MYDASDVEVESVIEIPVLRKDVDDDEVDGMTEIGRVFTKIAEAENKLGERAQAHLSRLPVAAAAELMSRAADSHMDPEHVGLCGKGREKHGGG